MTRPPQIKESHLQRSAVVYIRQSTAYQVQVNTGSTEVQRNLPPLLREWGWPDDLVVVIDDDLGVTGSIAGARTGFRTLLEEMRAGLIGLVAVTTSSRLYRNLPDLAGFIEAARENDVLLLQGGQIIDFRDPNSAFIGLILGANDERENRARILDAQRARREKAKKGIATTHPPIGYLAVRDGQWIKDPDPEVRDVIQLIFDKYVELGSVGAVARAFHKVGLRVPESRWRRCRRWKVTTRTRVFEILKHPAYAGVYVFGRTAVVRTNGRRRQIRQPKTQWVWIEEHHDPYVALNTWHRIQDSEPRRVSRRLGYVRTAKSA